MKLESNLNASVRELNSDILRSHAELDAKIDRRPGGLETRMERTELNRWGLLIMLGNVALSAGATALLNAFR
jgi:hypothetical protein